MAAPGLGIWGGYLRGNTHFGGGQHRILRNLPSPFVAKIFDLLDFSEIFFLSKLSRPAEIFHGPTYKNFSRTYQNVIFLATFHKFLQFCLSNSDFSITFGHFSQKSPLCRCGFYSHGSQRLIISTEIIKNWGRGQNGGQKIIWGAFTPLCPLPLRRHCLFLSISAKHCLVLHNKCPLKSIVFTVVNTNI